jgi:CBS domain containing-hemolysin-like protein
LEVNIQTRAGGGYLLDDGLAALWNLLFIFMLVLMNGFFVAAEFALVKVRGTRISQLVNEGNSRAQIAQHVTSHLDAYLSACQLGITLASLGLGWVGEPAIAHMIVEPLLMQMHAPLSLVIPVSLGVAFAVITVLHIVLRELAPKSIAIAKAEETSLWLSGPLMLFYKIAYPGIWLLNGMANFLLRPLGIEPASEQDAGHTEEEIRILMKESQKSGHIDQDELKLVENVFAFSERLAREVMIPRTMMNCLYTDLSFEENLQIMISSGHTRFPLAEEEKDRLLGFVLAKEVYNAALLGSRDKIDLTAMARTMPNVPESMEVSHVLRVMQREKVQMVVVVDEYGGTAGIITMEDLVEEIVGDIQDELKDERPEVEFTGDQTIIDGRLLIDKIN